MIEKIKIKLRNVFIPIFLSVIIGSICGKVIYNIYETDSVINDNLVYLIQSGAYSTYDNMRANTMGSYVYYESDGLYKTIIGITKDKDNVNKIKDAYGKEVVVNSYYTNQNDFINKIDEYDDKLKKASSNEEVQEIVLELLDLYKDSKNIEISKVS